MNDAVCRSETCLAPGHTRSAHAVPRLPQQSAGALHRILPLARCLFGLVLLEGALPAQVTERISLGPNGSEPPGGADLPLAGRYVSQDGRFVAFRCGSSNMVPSDTNGHTDVFVRDRLSGTNEIATLNSAGLQANAESGLFGFCISSDGRFVAFWSLANNLVSGDTNGVGDIFLRDRSNGTTERVSVDTGGVQGDGNSMFPSLSEDGGFVAYCSLASNLVPGDTNGVEDIFVRDRLNGTTERVSVSSVGGQGNGQSAYPSVSADGRFIAFQSWANNLVPADSNGTVDVFVKDRSNGTTERVSISNYGIQANAAAYFPSIAGDGRYVSFKSEATNLIVGDTNGCSDVFVHDRLNASTDRVSVATGGQEGDLSTGVGYISENGRYVAFESGATNLVAGTTGTAVDIYVRDLRNQTTERISVTTAGTQVNSYSQSPSISFDGRFVASYSGATDVVPNDTNAASDVFLHDRSATGFTSLCDPGANNVIGCPCGNPPSGSGRGCDNSSSTGGAALSASGIAYLSIDSLVFTTSGEKPGATSILLQGSMLLPGGLVFGQGVRCAGGALKRLYVKTAANGAITAPDLGVGDAKVSVRCAALGSPIQPGASNYFLVYYRDPVVLGGCSAMDTFNATQTGAVTWWP